MHYDCPMFGRRASVTTSTSGDLWLRAYERTDSPERNLDATVYDRDAWATWVTRGSVCVRPSKNAQRRLEVCALDWCAHGVLWVTTWEPARGSEGFREMDDGYCFNKLTRGGLPIRGMDPLSLQVTRAQLSVDRYDPWRPEIMRLAWLLEALNRRYRLVTVSDNHPE